MNTETMEKTKPVSKLNALSHADRLAIFRLLVGAGGEGLNAGEIAAALDLKPNTLSAHLTTLSSVDLIRSRREGRNIRYFAEMGAMRALLGYLMQDCCGGNPEVVRPALDAIHCEEREGHC
jgi:ArsR family transcriptional regulator